MKVLLTLTDVEPAVRLNALLEAGGIPTALVSPMDDVQGALAREKPDVIVLTGGLTEPANMQLVRRQLWKGAAVVGFADVDDPAVLDRLRALGYAELYVKPVDPEEVAGGIRRLLEAVSGAFASESSGTRTLGAEKGATSEWALVSEDRCHDLSSRPRSCSATPPSHCAG